MEIFVLANYTPVRKNARAYIKIALECGVYNDIGRIPYQ